LIVNDRLRAQQRLFKVINSADLWQRRAVSNHHSHSDSPHRDPVGGGRLSGLDPLVEDGRRCDDDIRNIRIAETLEDRRRGGESNFYAVTGFAPE
jgi:hypothetical protein